MKKIEVNVQSSVRILGNKVIYFDPLEVKKHKHDADFIFITHPHFDHYSLLAILDLKKENTIIVTTKDIVEELLSVGILEEYICIVKPFEHYNFKSLEFDTIPAYNLHKSNHKKDFGWVSYILDFEGVRYYVAGDTDATREAKMVKCDVCFVPVGGTYTMDCIDAANLVNIIEPKVAIPYHYGYVAGSRKDAEVFKKKLNKNIKCELLLEDDKHGNRKDI